MKKILAVAIAVFMLVTTSFAGLAMAADAQDLTGEWHIHSAVQEGIEMDASMLSVMGMDMVLTLNEDGTAIMNMGGEPTEGTWSFDGEEGEIAFEGEPAVLTVEDDCIVVGAPDGQTMKFSRDGASAPEVSLGAAVEDPELSDFNGTWKATVYVMFGMPMPLAAMGADITVTIEDGTVAYSAEVLSYEEETPVKETIESEFTAALQDDGVLFVDFEGEDVLSAIGMESDCMLLTLHEDDKISCTTPEILESVKYLEEASAENENTAAEEAEGAEDASGESDGESADNSSGASLDTYLLLERAE